MPRVQEDVRAPATRARQTPDDTGHDPTRTRGARTVLSYGANRLRLHPRPSALHNRMMSRVESLERAVESLNHSERAAFAAWFETYQAEAWDRQIDADAQAGRLDLLADRALADLAAGRARDL